MVKVVLLLLLMRRVRSCFYSFSAFGLVEFWFWFCIGLGVSVCCRRQLRYMMLSRRATIGHCGFFLNSTSSHDPSFCRRGSGIRISQSNLQLRLDMQVIC
jgi:hypothetical protein